MNLTSIWDSYIEPAKQAVVQFAETTALNTVFYLNLKSVQFVRWWKWVYETHLIHYPFIEQFVVNAYIFYQLIKIICIQQYEELIYNVREPEGVFLSGIILNRTNEMKYVVTSKTDKYNSVIVLPETQSLRTLYSPPDIVSGEDPEIKLDESHVYDEINVDIIYYNSHKYNYMRTTHYKNTADYTYLVADYNILLLGKDHKERYYSRLITVEDRDKKDLIWKDNIESDVSFFSISYSHPKMKESIAIDISPKYMYVGNEILSRAFIARYLTLLPNYTQYIFDNEYVIDILDSNFNEIQLKWEDYLLIEKDSCTKKHFPNSSGEDDLPPSLKEDISREPELPECRSDETPESLSESSPKTIRVEECSDDDGVIISHAKEKME